jgi:murein L,D-transpeptidase YcbB/YkuD
MWSRLDLANRKRRFRASCVVVPALALALAVFAPSSRLDLILDSATAADAGDSTSAALKHLLDESDWRPSKAVLDWSALRRFYSSRDYQPAWTSSEDDEKVHDALAHADREGLAPGDYGADIIKQPSIGNAIRLAHYDLLLTNSLLRYARDVREGRVSAGQAYSDAALPSQHYDEVRDLASALNDGSVADYLASLPPSQEGYRGLRTALAHYREIAAQGGWPKVPVRAGTSLFSDGRMQWLVTQRLAMEDNGVSPDEKDREQLRQAIVRFQQRHGLAADGRLNADTIEEMNVSPEERSAQIALNMERWRWLPRSFGARYVEVNVPSASLEAFDQGQSMLKSRVIVGREKDPTPLLRADANAITVNPSWEIPQKIASKEILPKARRHRSYLRSHHMVVDHNSNHLRQLPGPDNALGSLKIEMPNRFNVYLHDTPGQTAFAHTERTESHGCMRVEQILPLASFALSGSTDQAAADLQDAIAARETQKIALPTLLPVYVVYWTATTTDDGTVQFWPDPYDRDDRLHDALQKQVVASRVSML